MTGYFLGVSQYPFFSSYILVFMKASILTAQEIEAIYLAAKQVSHGQ